MPRFGMLERGILERSGFSEKQYPTLFMILYDRHMEISLFLCAMSFLFMLCMWRDRN